MECCIGLLRLCDEVIVLGDQITAGMARELDEAHSMGMKTTRGGDL